MAEYPGLLIWTDAYLADTTGLSTEEHGAYLLLLMAAWRTRTCSLPDDDVRLARMARVGTKKWRRIRPAVLEAFFDLDDGQWTQKRLLVERKRAATLRHQRSEAGKASALKRQETRSTSVGTERQPSTLYTNTPKKEESKREVAALPAGKRKGSRWSDKVVSPEWRRWACDNVNMSDGAVQAAQASFVDYWIGVPGQRGVKLDWFATWRNWCRREKSNGGQRSNAVGGREFGNAYASALAEGGGVHGAREAEPKRISRGKG